MLLNKEINLSGQSTFNYLFENQIKGAQDNRFFILFKFDASTSLLSLGKDEQIQIYPNLSGILVHTPTSDPVRQIQVFDLQGKKIYEENFSEINTCQIPANFETHSVIVKVNTQNQVKSKKILLTNKIR